jgi:hypothetical protein
MSKKIPRSQSGFLTVMRRLLTDGFPGCPATFRVGANKKELVKLTESATITLFHEFLNADSAIVNYKAFQWLAVIDEKLL